MVVLFNLCVSSLPQWHSIYSAAVLGIGSLLPLYPFRLPLLFLFRSSSPPSAVSLSLILSSLQPCLHLCQTHSFATRLSFTHSHFSSPLIPLCSFTSFLVLRHALSTLTSVFDDLLYLTSSINPYKTIASSQYLLAIRSSCSTLALCHHFILSL